MTRLASRIWPLLLVAVPVLALASIGKHVKDPHWSDKYDRHFKKYSKHYFGPHFDWYWFKAQGIAESGLRPNAESAVGAKGIMQIMPRTYQEIKKKNPHFVKIEEPRWNIAAGIFYDRMQYRKWKQGLPTQERLSFALASYNAGYGAVRKAYKRAKNRDGEIKEWMQVAPFAPKETRNYIRRIKGLMHVAN